MRPAKIAIALHLLLFCFCLQANAKDKKITVAGELVRAAGIGGESTGWIIQLEKETTLGGEQVDSIEVQSTTAKLDPFVNKRVSARGTLTTVHGVERGDRTVLNISSIKELKDKGKS
jgi:hypothetical protein